MLIGRKVNVHNYNKRKDPLGTGTVTGLNKARDQVTFENWTWWNGDRTTVQYLSFDVIKRLDFNEM